MVDESSAGVLRMRSMAFPLLVAAVLTFLPFWERAPGGHRPDADEKEILALEDRWLHARDAVTLERILATDFVHPVSAGVFLTKEQHIDSYIKHLPPASRKTRFEQVKIRFYGGTAIVNGVVIASDESGKELDRSVFTDVFVYRDGRWQAVNAQENRVEQVTGHR
jgi:hypothetical protein